MPRSGTHFALILCASFTIAPGLAASRFSETDVRSAIQVFVSNCFSPFLTGESVERLLHLANNRYDFYDLSPFSKAAPTPAGRSPVTPGTDRRCEVSFDGDATPDAVDAVTRQLAIEGIVEEVPVPNTHTATQGTALLAARRLNPRRIAVVHIGTRPGPNGIETFMTVERLKPSDN